MLTTYNLIYFTTERWHQQVARNNSWNNLRQLLQEWSATKRW